MLGKVLKYDFKAVIKYLGPLYLVFIGFAIIIRFLSLFDVKGIIQIINALLIVGFVLLVAFSFVLTGIFCVKYYLENLFKDEGYLTHTLPVKKGTLLLSKVLTDLIFVLITFAIVVISVIVAFYQGGMFKELPAFLGQTFDGIKVYQFFLFIGFYGIIAYLTTILMVYAAIAIGFSKSTNKVFHSVKWALVFYFAMEFLYLGMLILLVVIRPAFVVHLESNMFMLTDLLNFLMIFMIFTACLGGIFYFTSYKFIEKKLNLE